MSEPIVFHVDVEATQALRDLDVLRDMAIAHAATHPEGPSAYEVYKMCDNLYWVLCGRGLARTAAKWKAMDEARKASPPE